jgi:ABC-type transporter Mla subunit MlaD
MFISINDILIFLAIFLGVSLGLTILVLLIVAQVRLIKTIGKVNKIIDDNSVNIERTIERLPHLTESIDRTLTSVDGTLNGVNDVFFETKSTTDMITTIITVIESVMDIIARVFSKNK